MTGLLLIGAFALWFLTKKKDPEQIGKVKFLKAISEAQKCGFKFGTDKTKFTGREILDLDNIGKSNGYRQTKTSRESGKPYHQAVYDYLNSKFKQIAGIGKIDYPYTPYKIYNENDDLVLEYRDYDPDLDLRKAIDELDAYVNMPRRYGELATYAFLADGGKFVWESKKTKSGTRTAAGVKDELFGSDRTPAETHQYEKKARRKILGSPDKGAQYPVKFAESISSNVMIDDSREVLNGVLDALRSCSTPEDAKKYLLDQYYEQYRVEDPQRNEDLPF